MALWEEEEEAGAAEARRRRLPACGIRPPTPCAACPCPSSLPTRSAASGLTPEQKGVLVRQVQPISHAAGVLMPGDVITSFDGVEVASGERLAVC